MYCGGGDCGGGGGGDGDGGDGGGGICILANVFSKNKNKFSIE